MFLFIADHGTRRGYSDSRRYVESSVITSFYIHFTLHCQHNMTICGLSLHHRNTESRKNLQQKFIFQLGTLYPPEIINASHSTNIFTNSCHHISTNCKPPPHSHLTYNTPQFLNTLSGRRGNFVSAPKPGVKYNLTSGLVNAKK